MANPSRLLRRLLSDSTRRKIAYVRRLVRGFIVRRLISLLALLISPVVALAVGISAVPGGQGAAESLLAAVCRIPVFIAYPVRVLAMLQQKRGKVDEPAALLLRIAQHRSDPASLRAANQAFTLAIGTRPGWYAVANHPAPTTHSDATVVIGSGGSAPTLRTEDWHCVASDLIAESALDVSATRAVALLDGVAPARVVAQPDSPYDFHTLAVADALARWAACTFAAIDPGPAPTQTEWQQRSHAKVREFMTQARPA